MAATKEDCCSLVEWCCARGFTHDSKGGSFFDFATHFVGVPWTHSYAELVRSLRSLSDTVGVRPGWQFCIRFRLEGEAGFAK